MRVPAELDGVVVGGVVALHWDHVCGVLDRRQQERLQLETTRHLALANDGESGLALQI